ncbi:MAG TPA: SRPBCC family protein [Verrucomicrobiae bacterium]|nr:SRPBCC family protein [Verrucomicrobiae bacterium]
MKKEKIEFVYATFIRTTPEKLWEALTSGEFSQKYWFGFRFEAELKAGGTVRIHPPPGMEQHGDHKGEVLVCEPNRKLVYTWQQNDTPEIAKKRDGLSRVTYELTPMGSQVKLRLIHENLLPEDVEKDPSSFKGINNGWPAVISSLKSLLENGVALDFGMKGCGSDGKSK